MKCRKATVVTCVPVLVQVFNDVSHCGQPGIGSVDVRVTRKPFSVALAGDIVNGENGTRRNFVHDWRKRKSIRATRDVVLRRLTVCTGSSTGNGRRQTIAS